MKTYLVISCYFKGSAFIKECKLLGNKVILVTSEKLKDKPWPLEFIDDMYYIPSENEEWKIDEMIAGLAHLIKTTKIDHIIALDDFDVEKAAEIRETFEISGMGKSTARNFRDKLAMRTKAKDFKIPIPEFVSLQNDDDINKFLEISTSPWIIKPRSMAGAIGVCKVETKEEFWEKVNNIDNQRYKYIAEEFKPGSVFHVDSIIKDGLVIFVSASEYLSTPFDVAHNGGVFRTMTLGVNDKRYNKLKSLNYQVLKSFGMYHGVSHTEFIQDFKTGNFYFLETSSRVGGAHISELIEKAEGINLWKEWARLENAISNSQEYLLPKRLMNYGGLLICLCKQKHPDISHFKDKEVVWRMKKDYHVGLIVVSNDRLKVRELLDKYENIASKEFLAVLPALDNPSE